jgi:hypothetical protein
VFDNVATPVRMRLATIVCYHHRHYCTLVYNAHRDVWTSFDDANIKQVGHRPPRSKISRMVIYIVL